MNVSVAHTDYENGIYKWKEDKGAKVLRCKHKKYFEYVVWNNSSLVCMWRPKQRDKDVQKM